LACASSLRAQQSVPLNQAAAPPTTAFPIAVVETGKSLLVLPTASDIGGLPKTLPLLQQTLPLDRQSAELRVPAALGNTAVLETASSENNQGAAADARAEEPALVKAGAAAPAESSVLPDMEKKPLMRKFFGSLGERIGAWFDGRKEAASAEQLIPASAVEPYLASAPELPLPRVGPMWRRAGSPLKEDVAAKYPMGEIKRLSSEDSQWTFTENLELQELQGAVRTAVSSVRGDDKVIRSAWEIPGGVKKAAVTNSGFVWIDGQGDFCFYNSAKEKAFKVVLSRGRVQAFTPSRTGDSVYVVAGGILQRWDLAVKRSIKVTQDTLYVPEGDALDMIYQESRLQDGSETEGVLLRTKDARIFWIADMVVRTQVADEKIYNDFGTVAQLHPYGEKFFLQKTDAGTRVWRKSWQGSWTMVQDIGELPYKLHAVAETPQQGVYLAAVDEGLLEWDALRRRYRVYPVPGLDENAGPIDMHAVADKSGRAVEKVLLTAGTHLYQLEPAAAKEFLDTGAAQVYLWSQAHPMSVSEGLLHIGNFTFPVSKKVPAGKTGFARLWDALMRRLGLRALPPDVQSLGITEKEWKAANLPTNKKAIYETLKAFTLNQHVLYVGETGGGKTWLSEMIAKLTGNTLWLASMTEHTREKNLIFRETFGEEGKGRTGLTPALVLRWMQEGGLLVLDEIHKPIEGIAVLNNILQNGEYRMDDGRVVRYDPAKSFVIATMNPAKPPYKGEPPSGELASRFGLTLVVDYLPAPEEEALLNIFLDNGLPPALIKTLVSIANELRRAYPEILPLPVAPRTLIHIARQMLRFPEDDKIEAFKHGYNPSALLVDESITAAIDKVLQAHDLAGAGMFAPMDVPLSSPADAEEGQTPAKPAAAEKPKTLWKLDPETPPAVEDDADYIPRPDRTSTDDTDD